jgi:ubiquinone/menaquinone biosynthesis C-methylase UbiE
MRKLTGEDGSVVGIDVAANMIERANALTDVPSGIEFRRAAFEQLPFENNTFHGAFSMEALYYSTDLPSALREIFRVLRPSGTLAFCTDFFEENPHCHSWPGGLGIPMELLSEKGWDDAFENAGFRVARSFRCLDHREDNTTADDATIDFRTRIGALGILAIKPEGGPAE